MQVARGNRYFRHYREFQEPFLVQYTFIGIVEYLACYYSYEGSQQYLFSLFNSLVSLQDMDAATQNVLQYLYEAVVYSCQSKNVKFLQDVLACPQVSSYLDQISPKILTVETNLPQKLNTLSKVFGVGFKIQLSSGTVLTINRTTSLVLYLHCQGDRIKCLYYLPKYAYTQFDPFTPQTQASECFFNWSLERKPPVAVSKPRYLSAENLTTKTIRARRTSCRPMQQLQKPPLFQRLVKFIESPKKIFQ